jgi:hypothetical protein
MQGWMSVYECVDGKEVGGRGVWQTLGGIGYFLCYFSSKKKWLVTMAEKMEAGNRNCFMDVITPPPDQITEQREVDDGTAYWHKAPKLRVRVCSSVKKSKHRMEQEQVQALKQSQQLRRLVLEGLVNDPHRLMAAKQLEAVYELMKGKVMSRRAVWQMQGDGEEWFLYHRSDKEWYVSNQENMEKGGCAGTMCLSTAALTPDQALASEAWKLSADTKFVVAAQALFVALPADMESL